MLLEKIIVAIIKILAGVELVHDLQFHMPNWFPFETGILLS